MQVTAVSCNQCGGSLDIPETARFATCRYCGTKLEIKRNESAVFTEVLSQVSRNTADIEALRRENEIERLDREWQMRREQLMIRNKDGSMSEPSSFTGTLSTIMGIVAGIVIMIAGCGFASRGGAGIAIPIIGIVAMLFGIANGVTNTNKARAYEAEYAAYLNRRAQLLEGLSESSGSFR